MGQLSSEWMVGRTELPFHLPFLIPHSHTALWYGTLILSLLQPSLELILALILVTSHS